MEKKDIKEILKKVDAGEYTEDEEQVAKLWLFQLNNKNKAQVSEPELTEVSQRILARLENHEVPATIIRSLWPRIAVAVAAAVAFIVLGVYFFNYSGGNKKDGQAIQYANDVAPGKFGATLTLASGKKIRLADAVNGEIAKEAGIVVTKTADGQITYEIKETANDENKINTLTTAKGETYILVLPDQSKVWMNAASSLTYTANLTDHGKRRVKLSGEAYFQVAKDKAHPFIVEAGDQQVEVLGTQFNVNAYSDESVISTTLLEGSVKLSESGTVRMLIPGQQAINRGGSISTHQANTSLVTAWKNNNFIFDRLSIQEIMRMISRWYNVEVIYEGTAPKETFWGSISRFENVGKVLNALERTGNVHFKIEERRIYVSQ